MKCPLCGSTSLQSLWSQTRDHKLPRRYSMFNIVRRRRACRRCNHLFWTIECLEEEFLLFINNALEDEIRRQYAAKTIAANKPLKRGPKSMEDDI